MRVRYTLHEGEISVLKLITHLVAHREELAHLMIVLPTLQG